MHSELGILSIKVFFLLIIIKEIMRKLRAILQFISDQ